MRTYIFYIVEKIQDFVVINAAGLCSIHCALWS